MKSLIGLTLLSAVGFAQYDFDCNSYSLFPAGYCYGSSTTNSYVYDCNGTDAMTYFNYDTWDCSGDVNVMYTYDGDTYSSVNCGNDDDCDYYSVWEYNGDDCTDDTAFRGVYVFFITNQCYTADSTSAMYSCSGDTYTVTSYTAAGDCSGDSVSVSLDYVSYYNDYYSGSYCYTAVCSAGGSAGERVVGTMYAVFGALLLCLFY
jgi:hypothetical protein